MLRVVNGYNHQTPIQNAYSDVYIPRGINLNSYYNPMENQNTIAYRVVNDNVVNNQNATVLNTVDNYINNNLNENNNSVQQVQLENKEEIDNNVVRVNSFRRGG